MGELTLDEAGGSRALFAAAATGEPEAQRRVFAAHFEGVYVFLRMALADPSTAERAAVDSLAAALERCEECPPGIDEVDPWLRGLALEQIAALAIGKRATGPVPPAPTSPDAERLRELLLAASDFELAALVRSLEPRCRQAVVLGLMSGLDDRTVAHIAALDADEVPALQHAGLAEITRLLESYRRGTEQIAADAREQAYHLRPRRGPGTDGVLVIRGTKLMVQEALPANLWAIAIRLLERMLRRLRHPLSGHDFDADVGPGAQPPREIGRTASQKSFRQPDPTPSLTPYRAPSGTPGIPEYRQPKGTPSTERISADRRKRF